MALKQIGYLGRTGPTFEDDSAPGGLKYILQGQTMPSGVVGLFVKDPKYATALGLNASEYTLGSYSDNQRISDVPSFKQPAGGFSFDGFDTNVLAMVTGTTIPGAPYTTGTGSTSTGSTSTGGSTSGGSSSTGGSTSGGSSTGTDVTFSAPTVMEQISTFASNYWWLLLIIGGFLLWKPVIAPALGLGKKKRSYR